MTLNTDYLIVGAGITGLTLAERISSQLNKRAIVVDHRNHFGGNLFDANLCGIRCPKYGLHYFHTNHKHVYDYLSLFTRWWMTSRYEIMSWTDGKMYPFPICLGTYELFMERECTEDEFKEYLALNRIAPVHEGPPKNGEEAILAQVGLEFYNKFYRNYTIKQWGVDPSLLDPSVLLRHPIRTDRNCSRSTDTYQCMPYRGYLLMFNNMLEACRDNATLLVNTDYFDYKDKINAEHIIYTGPIDRFFNYQFGRLPYRSIRHEVKVYNARRYQYCAQVNFPNDDKKYTRAIEVRHTITGEYAKYGDTSKTAVIYEYPQKYEGGTEPVFPILTEEGKSTYLKYQDVALDREDVTFAGGLATFQYLNIAESVEQALATFETLKKRH